MRFSSDNIAQTALYFNADAVAVEGGLCYDGRNQAEVFAMAELTMRSYKLHDLQFFNKLDKPGQVGLESSFSFSVSFNDEKTQCMAKLYQCVKDKSGDANHNFFISVEMTGIFAVEGAVTDEDKKDIHVSCYEQLFPYAEIAAAQVCAMGGMPGFRLLRQKMDRNNVSVNRTTT